MRRATGIGFALVVSIGGVGILAPSVTAQTETPPYKVTSPDKRLELDVSLGADGGPAYSVTFMGKPVIVPSALGMELKQGGMLSPGMKVTGVRRDEHDSTYELVVGKTKTARDHYSEMTISLEESAGSHRKLDVVARAYDDGVAFRYVLPAQPGLEHVEIVNERTEFRFPTDLPVWALQLPSFRTSYEGEYDRLTSGRIQQGAIVGLPLVSQNRDRSVTIAISESDLVDYAGMYFTGLSNGYGVAAKLAPRREDASSAVQRTMTSDGVRSPWRVIMVATQPARLVESTLIQNLSTPNQIGDTSWVTPGKSAWDWWSGPAHVGLPNIGMNDDTMKHYIDFASKMHLQYMLVDAGWYTKSPSYGSGMDPNVDITKTIPEIHLPELVQYGKDHNVGIWLWLHWSLAEKQMNEAFPLYEKLGIKGVKIDFMDSDDQYMVDFYHRVLAAAAKHHLMVDLHGAYKPTGLARTFPNYVTQEGVMGAEYNKWSARITATHNVSLAYTRLLIGPMDYTPGAFRNRAPTEFEVRGESPQVMTTRSQQLAMYVVYESPFACVSDNPEAYDGQAGADFLGMVPTTWDETRGVAGELGEYIVVARRHGTDWYLGAMNNEHARDVDVPLDFLGSGKYRVRLYSDGSRASDTVVTTAAVEGKTLHLTLSGSGGAAARFEAVH